MNPRRNEVKIQLPNKLVTLDYGEMRSAKSKFNLELFFVPKRENIHSEIGQISVLPNKNQKIPNQLQLIT